MEIEVEDKDFDELDRQIAIKKEGPTSLHNPFEPWIPFCQEGAPFEFDVDALRRSYDRREFVAGHLGWGVPTEAAIRKIAGFAPQGVVEIGAGWGAWAYMLHQLGIEVDAFDLREPTHRNENGHQWFDVRSDMNHVRAGRWAAEEGRALMFIWPSYSESWPAQALRQYRKHGGKQLIYVGEGGGGCTADDAFHRLIEWSVDRDVFSVPQWRGLHDYGQLIQF